MLGDRARVPGAHLWAFQPEGVESRGGHRGLAFGILCELVLSLLLPAALGAWAGCGASSPAARRPPFRGAAPLSRQPRLPPPFARGPQTRWHGRRGHARSCFPWKGISRDPRRAGGTSSRSCLLTFEVEQDPLRSVSLPPNFATQL